jgi:two-component system, chemotaxis family, chemotaxis protein CheY
MDGYGKRVLIIDDNEDILYLAGTALMDRGYNVYTAADGFQGSEQMEKRRYDVVLVDYQMPRVNGLQFIEACHVKWPETPIILMSGDDFLIHHCDRVKGIYGYIAKPFELLRMIELVNRACLGLPGEDRFTLPRDGRQTDSRSSRLRGRDTSHQATREVPLTN